MTGSGLHTPTARVHWQAGRQTLLELGITKEIDTVMNALERHKERKEESKEESKEERKENDVDEYKEESPTLVDPIQVTV